ncbi:ABC transporter permease [Roseibium sp. MMSF_3544]|uniref:ABC transporter permease n=1 Tax=unclassified Roseibium TaxID=2629323 RepID=UPI00273E5A6B|nr:ABC transporter permease [Roseibium sp. MMSF_3544]
MDSVLITQGRVIGALVLRETRTTFGASQLGYLWAILNPAVGVALLTAIFTAVGRVAPFGTSLALFFATGLLTFELYKKLSTSLMVAFEANQALMTYPLVQALDVIIARAILILATYILVMFLFFGGLIALQLAHLPANFEEVAAAIFVTSLLGTGVGTTYAVICSVFGTWKQIEGILSRPLFFMSGIFYVPHKFPPEIVNVLSWNPVLHLVEWMREGYYPNYNSVVLDKPYVLAFTLISLLVGFGSERLYRKSRAR